MIEYKIWYRGTFGRGPKQLATVHGVGDKNGHIILDCRVDGEEYDRWGYVYQFEPLTIEETRQFG